MKSPHSRDIHNYRHRLENTIKNLRKSRINEEDRKLILDLMPHLKAEGLSDGRISKYVFHLLSMARIVYELDFKFQEVDKKNIEEFVARIESSDYTENTKHDYKVILKRFDQWLRGSDRDEHEYPSEVKWIKTTIKRSKRRLPEDLLTQEEVLKMVEKATNQRDKAFISTLYDLGGRIGEVLSLRIKDVEFEKDLSVGQR